MTAPQGWLLAGGRLRLYHGPIDLIIEARGRSEEVTRAYFQAAARFQDILEILVSELPNLRRPLGESYPRLQGPVARRMAAAVWPHRRTFVTPMAAVAGAVADEILMAMTSKRSLRSAYVNNGGDIAVYSAAGERLEIGIIGSLSSVQIDLVASIGADMGVGGMATSGWRGKSLSLGIADAVTVVAENAAAADAAATLIANAVNLDHPAVVRRPACDVEDDSDLGQRLVTVAVGALPEAAVELALSAGAARAETMRVGGLIVAASLALQGRRCLVPRDEASDDDVHLRRPTLVREEHVDIAGAGAIGQDLQGSTRHERNWISRTVAVDRAG